MSKKKWLTVREAELEFPEAFRDATGAIDKRLDERMKRDITHHLNQGESAADAKLKAMCVAKSPDHWEQLPNGGPFPKLVYNEDGTTKKVEDQTELDKLLKQKEWSLKPSEKYVEKAQRGSTPRDENIKRLQKELDSEVKKKQAEEEPAVA